MRLFLRLVDGAAAAAAVAAALCLALLTVIVLAEIAVVWLFNFSLDFSWEYAAFLMCAAFFLGMGWTLRQGGHVRVSLFAHHLPPGPTRALDMLATLAGLVISGFLTFALGSLAWGAFIGGSRTFTPTATPLAVPQGVATLGMAILTLVLVARLVRLATGEEPDEKPADGGIPSET
ncbi:TRAP transporter small permease subunit [Marinimicrococcus flavescens]|uniref:TRAP transporter small permease protein n=1 Tax=Marinimicrococcus flavescens TaxID=3031815 RepID=A0AAP3UXG1_9PROT|nr:TRAP transporter small permease [Marinimicrococcus flavescens]